SADWLAVLVGIFPPGPPALSVEAILVYPYITAQRSLRLLKPAVLYGDEVVLAASGVKEFTETRPALDYQDIHGKRFEEILGDTFASQFPDATLIDDMREILAIIRRSFVDMSPDEFTRLFT